MKKMLLCLLVVASFLSVPVFAISEEQEILIKKQCGTIKDDLKTVQYADSRARVYLGRHYETILSKYITPLNMRLVENNLSDNALIDNQDNFAKARSVFIIDFIEYQKALEELVGVNCKTEPEKFYDDLVVVRGKRKAVANDVASLKKLINEQIKLSIKLKERL